MKRLFVAIKIKPNAEFLYQYEHIIEALQSQNISWISPENMHITTKFIGKVEGEIIPEIISKLGDIAFHSYPIEIENLGLFGSRYDPRVVWARVSDKGETTQLAEKIIVSMHEIGLLRGRQNFVPHLSLGRIKKTNDNKYFQQKFSTIKESFFQECRVRGFHLYQSLLIKNRIQYKSIKYFPFEETRE